jgi:ATP-dependent RNA helicase DDX3X
MGSVLTRTLLETDQEIPDFLQQHVPEGEAREKLKFEADSDFDPNDYAGAGDAGDAWGGNEGNDAGASCSDAWGGVDDGGKACGGDAWGAGDKGKAGAWDDTSSNVPAAAAW